MPEMLTHGISIEYDVHGDGPALILIGGLGFGRWSWFKQVPALSNHFRTIAFDVRGEQSLSYGVADLSAEVVTLLDHLGIEKAHVLGTSLGGFVAQELALERPDLVDKLVLVCTSYGSHAPETMSPQALGRMLGWGALSPENATRRGLETATSDAYRNENPDEFNLILRWRLADSPSLATYYQQAMAGARFDASHDVENIASPTLVIHGADDRYMPVANAVALAESIPVAKLRVFEDAGHLVFLGLLGTVWGLRLLDWVLLGALDALEGKKEWGVKIAAREEPLTRQVSLASDRMREVPSAGDEPGASAGAAAGRA